uniref:Ring finger protein 34b n=1 Tax=Sinocyclocheilus rhinocerous TaxID=307959 RepID=A0A673KX38_9TELE
MKQILIFQTAGASSMWASCCGLLNEVMGTGAVRTQQPGFGAGAGPFRFAPSAGYSTYPPSSSTSGSAGLACKACGLAFSVFRRKHVCSDCKKSFCSLCSVLQENLRRCATCHLLWGTAFQRPRLMRLRVKDLRQYLTLRNISTDTCREKEDLVDLVLCHLGAEADTDSLPSLPRSLSTPPASAARSSSQQSALSVAASQGEALSHSDSSGTTNQVRRYPEENLMSAMCSHAFRCSFYFAILITNFVNIFIYNIYICIYSTILLYIHIFYI